MRQTRLASWLKEGSDVVAACGRL